MEPWGVLLKLILKSSVTRLYVQAIGALVNATDLATVHTAGFGLNTSPRYRHSEHL